MSAMLSSSDDTFRLGFLFTLKIKTILKKSGAREQKVF